MQYSHPTITERQIGETNRKETGSHRGRWACYRGKQGGHGGNVGQGRVQCSVKEDGCMRRTS